MLPIDRLITHRFRGFAPQENTLAGLQAALDFGTQYLEFDIRVAKCGTPMIYHDAYAGDAKGRVHFLCDVMADDFAALGGTFSHMPSAEALFEMAGRHDNKTAKLLVDIKDAGFETEIVSLVHLHDLQDRVVYVSWVPEALYAIHEMSPEAELCLSHWCQKPNNMIRAKHKVFEAKSGHIPKSGRGYIHGETSGWFVDGPLKGRMREIVSSVCVPQDMATAGLVADYHASGIQVSTFSYIVWDHIMDHDDSMKIDLYFIDDKRVFDRLH